MKKVLVFLIVCLSSTVMLAQTHWTQITTGEGVAGTNVSMTGMLYVDHVLYYNGDRTPEHLEIGVFDQGGVCRCAKFPQYRANQDKWIYQLVIKGGPGFTYTFRVWDHEANMELENWVQDFPDEVIEWSSGGRYGSTSNLYEINFHDLNAVTGISKDIVGYASEGVEDQWYFLSSPVGTIAVNDDNVTNLVGDDFSFDFYAFNQSAEDGLEWRNYKAQSFNQMEVGHGYLYAREQTGTVTFNGNAYTGPGTFELAYDEDAELNGWNLMGNPFNEDVTVNVESFYVMEGADIVPAESEIVEPMQGIMIEATGAGQTVTFTPAEAGGEKKPVLSMNVSDGRGLVDRAIVRFGRGGQLHKYQLRKESTKLYIPMDGEDYAVVSSDEMGEMPVSFKAAKSGSYTMVVSSELSFNYLHLIDNKTGADVDLLATPSYSFEAQTTDYASRFKLVFATGDSDDTFAFYSNGSFVISNEGEAIVQVMDVTGRMLSSEAISGSASVNVDGAAGVYMIRLVNGESVKVQKVVVK